MPSDMPVPPMLSVVVPCMGRLHHLKQTAPALLAHPEIEYILVDYSCPDRCGDYARLHWPRAKVVEVPGETYFNKGRALNAGIRTATGRWLANLDADNVVGPHFVKHVLSLVSEDALVVHRASNWGTGFFVCSRRAFARTSGLSEEYSGWGGEDYDVRRRLLEIGLKLKPVPDDSIQVIEHDDVERTLFYQEKDKEKSNRDQRRRLRRFRLLPEFVLPWRDGDVLGLSNPAWREVWKMVQYACFVERLLDVSVRLYPYWHGWRGHNWTAAVQRDFSAETREILDLLDVPTRPSLLTAPRPDLEPVSRPVGHSLRCFRPAPARVRWRGWSSGRWRVAYRSSESPEESAAVNDCLAGLRTFASEYEMSAVNPAWPLRQQAELLSQCDLCLGADDDTTLLGYAVGLPVFLLTQETPAAELAGWQGGQAGLWCENLVEFLARVRVFQGGSARR